MNMETTKFIAGVAKKNGGWEGVIRLGRHVFWHCGHVHNNRHESTGTNPISAYRCSSTVLEVFNRPEAVKVYRDWLNVAYFSRAWQAQQARLGLKLYEWAKTQRRFLTV